MAKANRCQCFCHTHINHGNMCVVKWVDFVNVADKSPTTCPFNGLMPLYDAVGRSFHNMRMGLDKMRANHSDPDPIMELFLDRTVKLLCEAHRLLCDFKAVRTGQADLARLLRKPSAKS